MENWCEKTFCGPQEILEVLPHRYPFIMVDRVLEIKTAKKLYVGMSEEEYQGAFIGSYVKTIKNVSFNEHQFQGHFPNRPIFPGVLTLEFMAQSAAFILAPFTAVKNNGKVKQFDVALASFDKVKFRKPIVPGDQMLSEIKLINFRKNIFSFLGTVTVDQKVVAQGEFMAQMF